MSELFIIVWCLRIPRNAGLNAVKLTKRIVILEVNGFDHVHFSLDDKYDLNIRTY